MILTVATNDIYQFNKILGVIAMEDVLTVLPFRNSIDVIELRGVFLRQALELSVRDYSTVDAHGRFLQMSGI